MARIYYERDADLDALRSKRIAIIGYGNQGHAHAQNLRDIGCTVRVGSGADRPGSARAEADGFTVQSVSDVSEWADVISLLLPDRYHKAVFDASIRPYMSAGKMLMLAHGFSVQFDQVQPPPDVDVAMVAPVGPGTMMRRLFMSGQGIPAVFAIDQDVSGRAEQMTLAYATGLGCARAGVLRTTFQEETETDLFGEQAVLCGGLSALIKAGFDTLVENGYRPEIAYFECVHQVKLIVDLIYEGGLAYMRSRISDTAEFGDYVSGPRIIDERVRESMQDVLNDIRDGTFARSWIDEYSAGSPTVRRERESQSHDPIESVGVQLRSMMSWLGSAEREESPQAV